MSQLKLLGVVEVRQKLAQLLAKQQWQWLVNPPIFPLVINLGTPTQINLLNNPRGVNQWIEQWRAWQGGGELIWKSRRWSTLGQQCLPHCLVLNDLTENKALLIIRRNRSIGRNTGTLLSANDRILGDKIKKYPLLTLYRIIGEKEKGWDGFPLWIPNIKLPAGKIFWKTEDKNK